jgi:hypothetical protein
MRGLLPSVWLLGAALYTASILSLLDPFAGEENWPAPRPVNETVRAKEPHVAPVALTGREAVLVKAALAPEPQPKAERRNEWVEIAGYTTVIRAAPSATAPITLVYAAGRPLRVLERQPGFVRIQDLGSGKLGWVAESAVRPFTGGYRQPEDVAPVPQLVASTAPQIGVAKPNAQLASDTVDAAPAAPAAKKVRPHADLAAARAKKDAVAAAEPEQPRGFFLFRKRNPVQKVALGNDESGVAAIMRRALGRF